MPKRTIFDKLASLNLLNWSIDKNGFLPYNFLYYCYFNVFFPVYKGLCRMIDEIDRQIIMLLQDDARLSNSALAEAVGLTISTVHERVKKLEKKGIIKGYVAVVDAEALGKPIMAFIRLAVAATSGNYLESKDRVMSVCLAEPDVLEFHNVAGEDCFILKVRAASPKALEKLIERIRGHANISRSITNIVLSTFKDSSKIAPS